MLPPFISDVAWGWWWRTYPLSQFCVCVLPHPPSGYSPSAPPCYAYWRPPSNFPLHHSSLYTTPLDFDFKLHPRHPSDCTYHHSPSVDSPPNHSCYPDPPPTSPTPPLIHPSSIIIDTASVPPTGPPMTTATAALLRVPATGLAGMVAADTFYITIGCRYLSWKQ